MTTIKDLTNDLVIEAMKFGAENSTIYNYKTGEEKREELVEEFLQMIKDRILG